MSPRNLRRAGMFAGALALVLVWGGLVAASIDRQEQIARQAFSQARLGQSMLTAMLDQETGVRGYMLAGRDDLLDPYRDGVSDFEAAAGAAAVSAGSDRPMRRSLDSQVSLARRWRALAVQDIALKQRAGDRPASNTNGRERKMLIDNLRRENTTFQELLGNRRDDRVTQSGRETLLFVLLATLVFGVGFALIVRRGGRRELRYRRGQAEFSDALQSSRDEHDANLLLKRHLESTIRDLTAHVLNRNNSANRLEAVTPIEDGRQLTAALEGVEPRACMSVRRARPFEREATDRPLLACELCSGCAAATTCRPLIVGGEVIGAVLVEHTRRLDPEAERRIADSVAQAAPVIANLRNLAIAETRAATDALTGLPNRRAIHDGLLRMMAQADRSGEPMALVLADLDRFKEINDAHGHTQGDAALAAAGSVISASLRSADFAGRFGGEEFVLLLPATDAEGARAVAEGLRRRVEQLDLPKLETSMTASFGVAIYPVQAEDSEQLVRLADRALYRAKALGRNRVEVAEPEWLPDDSEVLGS